MKKTGLVGGISWVSTMEYYRLINEGVNQKMGGLNFAECLLYSLNFGAIQEKGWKDSYDLLYNACDSLKKSGVDAIALCANTAHLFADKLQAEIQLPFIHIAAETAKVARHQGLSKLGLLGTSFTMEMPFYRDKLKEYGVEVIIPENQATRDYLQHTIKEELGRGIILPATKQQYAFIAADLVKRGAEGIILGCTEIPMLMSKEDFSVPSFDTTTIHSQAIVDFMFS